MEETLKKFINSIKKMRADAESIFRAGLAAVAPESAVTRYCRIEDERLWVGSRCYNLAAFKNIYVIGCGKAAAAMATALERLLGEWITAGIVVVKYGHLSHLSRIRIIEAGHPVPDRSGEEGARAILALAEPAGHDDLVLCLISGGGSALRLGGRSLADPHDGQGAVVLRGLAWAGLVAAALALGIVLNEWNLLTLGVVLAGVILLSLVKQIVMPHLLDLV